MYRLTSRMLQHLRADLQKYHDLFRGGRCSGWELEELVDRAIKSDTQAQHHSKWKEAGHDDQADIVVQVNGSSHKVQIKSGKWSGKLNPELILSGHRLGRFEGNMPSITEYLNAPKASILAIPCVKADNEQGRTFSYDVGYISEETIVGLDVHKWQKKGAERIQTNAHGVKFSLRPKMSWQIWWRIPKGLIEIEHLITIQ